MPFYRICPRCRSYLDFGEHCDCQEEKKIAPSATNTEGGQVESELTDPHSTSHFNE